MKVAARSPHCLSDATVHHFGTSPVPANVTLHSYPTNRSSNQKATHPLLRSGSMSTEERGSIITAGQRQAWWCLLVGIQWGRLDTGHLHWWQGFGGYRRNRNMAGIRSLWCHTIHSTGCRWSSRRSRHRMPVWIVQLCRAGVWKSPAAINVWIRDNMSPHSTHFSHQTIMFHVEVSCRNHLISKAGDAHMKRRENDMENTKTVLKTRLYSHWSSFN